MAKESESTVAQRNWERYSYARDHGHIKYIAKADKCEKFYRAEQWEDHVERKLEARGKPALTINKTLATISTVQGELLNNRAEVSFRASTSASHEVAHTLGRVYTAIANKNRMAWLEQDVADDGFITSRGFYDVRVQMDDNMLGQVQIRQLNPRNVVIDPDADNYDPDTWGEVFITTWMSPQEIEAKYGKAKANKLRDIPRSAFEDGHDSIDTPAQSLGDSLDTPRATATEPDREVRRSIRVIERQHWKLRVRRVFLDPDTGDINDVPEIWDDERAQQVALTAGIVVTRRERKQIRWTVTADTVVLHDDWSPYKHFTVVPYFPYFRRGQTIGLVENLIGPQQQLNKISSQELHIVNSTANSGWKVKRGALTNMTPEELERRGAESGLVIEYDGESERVVDKIMPNQVPQGLDRIAAKADAWMKDISGVSDSMRGFDREDVAAKAIEAKQQRGHVNMAKPFDNLMRTRHLLAERVLHLIQAFYTEPRIMRITGERPTDEPEDIEINTPNAAGQITNDLTIGTYEVSVTTRPPHMAYEAYQFEEAFRLRSELGIHIPDHFLVELSNLEKKREVIEALGGDADGEDREAREQQQQMEAQRAQLEMQKAQADAQLAMARAQKVAAETRGEIPDEKAQMEQVNKQHELRLKQLEFEAEERRHQRDLEFQRWKAEEELALKEAEMSEKLEIQREAARRGTRGTK